MEYTPILVIKLSEISSSDIDELIMYSKSNFSTYSNKYNREVNKVRKCCIELFDGMRDGRVNKVLLNYIIKASDVDCSVMEEDKLSQVISYEMRMAGVTRGGASGWFWGNNECSEIDYNSLTFEDNTSDNAENNKSHRGRRKVRIDDSIVGKEVVFTELPFKAYIGCKFKYFVLEGTKYKNISCRQLLLQVVKDAITDAPENKAKLIDAFKNKSKTRRIESGRSTHGKEGIDFVYLDGVDVSVSTKLSTSAIMAFIKSIYDIIGEDYSTLKVCVDKGEKDDK